MVHQRQRLALGFEPGDDRLGVHAQLDDLESDPAADGLLLFGHVNHPAAAFTDLLQQLVATDLVAGLLGGRCGKDDGVAGQRGGGFLKKTTGLFMRLEQGFNLLAQLDIVGTGLGEVSGAFRGVRLLQRVAEDFLNLPVVVGIHRRLVFHRGRRKPPHPSRPRRTSVSCRQPVMRLFAPVCATRSRKYAERHH